MITWFDYNYISAYEIFNDIKLILNYSIVDFAVLVVSVIVVISLILYIFPIINLYIQYITQVSLKKKNMKMLKKISLQKDIENEIEKELA
jgi:hypothetical protein